MSERWQQIKEVLQSALERPADERGRFLDKICADDESLRREVETLLLSAENVGSFMENAAIGKVAEMFAGAQSDVQIGECFNHYEIIRQLGAGGMGEVYLAEDTKLNRRVALKLLPTSLSSDQNANRRLLREARAAAMLDHPHICQIHEIAESKDCNFIVMQYVKGETLLERLKREKLPLPEVLNIAVQIADALAEAHAHNIIHRDIKPANIIINEKGQAKVLDFGLAKFTAGNAKAKSEAAAELLSKSGAVMGTVPFMSPEQVRGKRLDARTDIFSFGSMLYEMLCGQSPFARETDAETISAILRDEPFFGEIPDELKPIVRKSLIKNADERYQTAKDLLTDLKRLQKRLEFEAELGVPPGTSPGFKFDESKTQILEVRPTDEKKPPQGGTPNANSIAVLPFANMSADAENEYFCDGLAEELLNALAKINDLKVAARTSAFAFKDKNTNVSEVGNILNVKTVLEGSVRRAGNRLRITVQLINAADGYHLWSERYDREMADIFDVQDEITLAVVDALKVKLFSDEKAAILERYTDNTEAYELYLKGRYHHLKDTAEGWLRGIEFFEKAIEIEPNYALAYSAIANCYTSLHVFGVLSPDRIVPEWKAVIHKALEIDERLAEAHFARANFLFWYGWNFSEAEQSFERAIKLNPKIEELRRLYGLFLSSQKRFDESIDECKYAVELNPLSLVAQLHLGWAYLFAFRYEGALEQVKRMREIEPDFHGAYWLLGSVYLAQENFTEAIDAFEKCMSLGGTPIAESYLGCAYGLSGRRDEASVILNRFLETREQHYAAAFHIARVYAGLGETKKVFDWLEKAAEDRNGEMLFFDFNLTVMASRTVWEKRFLIDPRYQDILRGVGLTL